MAILNRYTALAAAVALACSAWAQQPPDQYPPDQYSAGQFQDAADQSAQTQLDPPTRVARLAYFSGDVSFAPAGENEWVVAQRNRPMATGDKLYTNDGRAELQIGTSSILLDARSNMDFLTLNDQMTQIELTQGSLNVDVRRLQSGEVYEVDTPTIAFVADRVGDYRIDIDPNGQTTTVSVRRGSGEAIGEGGNRVRINEGEAIAFNDSQLSNYQTLALRSGDSFDTYSRERIARYERAPARRYVSEEVVGYEDLADNGTWEDASEYGHVWYPSGVAADWAPYHDGNWIWEDPWGWTWVDNASWGFAPFHYGRWAYIGSRWGWVPGPVDVRPVYAPALVAFVGGGGFGIDISVGGPIGWFALGPRDVYFPGYRCGRNYFRDVNVSNTVVNTTVVNNYYGAFSSGRVNYAQINYANRLAPRAVTAVPTTAFVSGRPVAASAIAVNRTMLTNARVLPRATVAPTAASLVANRGRATPPPAAVMNRTVVAANRPAPAPVPFAQRQGLLRKNPGQPLTTTQLRTVAAARPSANAPAGITRSNVRVAGAGGAAALNARANVRANAANAPANRNARQAPNPNARLPSARYTQQQRGAPPRESATAQQNASANARFNRGSAAPANAPRESATAQRNAAANARFNRGNAPPNTPAATAQTRAAEARANAQARQQERTNTQRMETQNRAAQTRANAHAQQQSRANEQRVATQQRARQQQERATTQRMEAQTRAAQARANAQAQQQNRANEQRIAAQQRAQQQQERASAQRMEAQNRAAQARANAQQRAQAQTQVREQQRAQAQVREQQRAQVQRAPAPMREPQAPRAQAQYREPPRPTSQRAQPQPRQQAKRKNEKDRDQRDGGGG